MTRQDSTQERWVQQCQSFGPMGVNELGSRAVDMIPPRAHCESTVCGENARGSEKAVKQAKSTNILYREREEYRCLHEKRKGVVLLFSSSTMFLSFPCFRLGTDVSVSALSYDQKSVRLSSLLVAFFPNFNCLRDSFVGSRIVGLRLSFAFTATSISYCVGDRRVVGEVILFFWWLFVVVRVSAFRAFSPAFAAAFLLLCSCFCCFVSAVCDCCSQTAPEGAAELDGFTRGRKNARDVPFFVATSRSNKNQLVRKKKNLAKSKKLAP